MKSTQLPRSGSAMPLRRKFMLIVLLATSGAMMVSALAVLAYEVRSYRLSAIEMLSTQAELLGSTGAAALLFEDSVAGDETLGVLRLQPQVESAALYKADGKLLSSYPYGKPPPAPPLEDGPRFDHGMLEMAQTVRKNDRAVGRIVLRAHHDVTSRIGGFLLILLVATGSGMALAAWIVSRLHHTITRPILSLATVARAVMQKHDYALRVTERPADEIGVAVDAFNNMLGDLNEEMRERQHAEAQLRTAYRRKDEMLATLAHELRNPLAPLSTALALLNQAEGRPEMRQRALVIMGRQVAHLTRLVNDILEASRFSTGRLQLKRSVLDLRPALTQAADAVEGAYAERHHALLLALPDSAVWVDADADRLAQVVTNLLNNACKYTEPGGTVRLEAHCTDDQAVVRVSDNGIGIAPDHLEDVFEMFMQVDTSLGRGSAGLGIGLSITRQLVELHGGTIKVESAGLGHGTTFTVKLPLTAAPATSPEALASEGASTAVRALRILIADDNVDFADSLSQLLSAHGHEVHVAHDGLSALQLAIDAVPDVAFLDIGMPGMTGYELMAELKARAATRDIVAVAVTGWGQPEDRERARRAGFRDHFVKPVDMGAVLAVVSGTAAQMEKDGATAGAVRGPANGPAADAAIGAAEGV